MHANWVLIGLPILLMVCAYLFLNALTSSSKHSYRRRLSERTDTLEQLAETMQKRIAGAREKGITTEFGSARAERLIAGARESIEHARSTSIQHPELDSTWETVARELKTAETMLNNVPIALADDQQATELPPPPPPAVLD